MLRPSTSKTDDIRDMETVSEHIIERVRERATSSHLDAGDVHIGSAPGDTFFSGCLGPGEEDLDPENDDIYSRISPSALHMFSKVSANASGGDLEIEPSFSLFYRVFPDWDTRDLGESENVYRKITPDINEVSVDFPSPEDLDAHSLAEALDTVEAELDAEMTNAIDQAKTEIRRDPFRFRDTDASEEIMDRFRDEGYDSRDEYESAIQSLTGDTAMPDPVPTIAARSVSKDNTSYPVELKLSLENRSPVPESKESDTIDNGLYNSNLIIREGSGLSFETFNFRRLPDDFRYQRTLAGYGINCSVEPVDGANGALRTTCLPIFHQHRYRHKTPEESAAVPRFRSLADDPIPVLQKIKNTMESYRDNEWESKITELQEDDSESADEARSLRDEFNQEISRFNRGIQVLQKYDEALKSFRLMNETFDRKVMTDDGTREYDSWRLFQIVFIVSTLPDVIAREYNDVPGADPEEVSLLWFPTGGGKTEAYLGLIVSQMLFDRIRGKEIGSSSMMRYPLRLLSLQQFQRITELFMYADGIRREYDLGGDPFTVGYLTGGTENKMRDVVGGEFQKSITGSPASKNRDLVNKLKSRWESGSLKNTDPEEFQFINQCPVCDGDVTVVVNAEDLLIDHRCTGDCDWNRLPIYVMDNEIYRYLPTMVVGTQDKLAAIGYERKFRNLIGYVAGVCPEHGYTDGTDCTEKYFCEVDQEGHQEISPKDPVPSLQVQDELHLIKETLGTFESHYWSAMEKLIEWAGYERPKLIAATATIEAYDNQISHLYQRRGNLFPSPGPAYRESYYATEDPDEVQRYFIGLTPWGRSHINSVISIIESQQISIQELRRSPGDWFDLDDFNSISTWDELDEMLRFYQTAINYVISKKEGARVYQSVETQINEDLTREGFDEISALSLTGDSSFAAVSEMLDRFEELPEDPGLMDQTEDLVVATSTISHGVDLDVLNFMVFFGMPRRTAEYIQSSSRVGRKYPGIVVDCFHPIRERDRSHYHYFKKYHEYLDRLVEPVPVNRWAKFSVDRTLPGMFMTLILQRHYGEIHDEIGRSPYMTATVAKAHSQGLITVDQIVEEICEIYGTDRYRRDVFRDRVERAVRVYMSAIDNKQEKWVSNSFPDDMGAMNSLRDVDLPVSIFTTSEDGRIVNNLNSGRGGGGQ